MTGSVSLIIPAHNEARRIGPTLERVCSYLDGRLEHEVVVVDDGSTDRTPAVVAQLARRHPQIRLLRQERHRGKGAAVRLGALSAAGQFVCFSDADLSTPIEELEPMLELLEHRYDVVIGSRAHPASQILVRQHPLREALGKTFNRAARLVVRVPFADTQCGFKGFRRAAAQEIFRRSRIDGFAFDVEVVLLAQALGWSVGELPVRWAHAPSSRVNPLVHSWQMLGELWAIRRRLKRLHRHPARLSVVVLAKNEEARIARCLESVRWADEIIVVDGMSADRTVEICAAHGAAVIRHAFEGSFAQERNLGLEAATGTWVLQIDADDVATPAFRDAVQRLLADDVPYDIVKFRRRSFLLGRFMRHGGWYHYLPNLVRREAVRYVGDVHERPVLRAAPDARGAVGRLEADIEHHPCSDLGQFLARHNRYTTLSALEWRRSGAPPAALSRRLRKTWWKAYVKKQGFREGMHGLVFSFFYAGVDALKWVKCGELSAAAQMGGGSWPSVGTTSAWVERRNRLSSQVAQRMRRRGGRVPSWVVAYRMVSQPAAVLSRAGRRQPRGDAGLSARAWLRAFDRFLVWAKYWEFGVVSRAPSADPEPAAARALEEEMSL